MQRTLNGGGKKMSRVSRHDVRRVIVGLSAAGVLLGLLMSRLLSAASSGQQPIVMQSGPRLMTSVDGGRRWEPLPVPFSRLKVNQVAVDQEKGLVIYAATEEGLYVSQDGGASWWKPVIGGRSSEAVLAVAVTGDRWLVGTIRGLFISDDGGRQWRQVGGGLAEAGVVISIEVGRRRGSVIYVGTERQGVYRSDDGGRQWRAINEGLPHAVGAAPVTPVQHVVIDPRDEQVAYASTEVYGIYKTSDGGQRWRAINEGLPGLQPYRTYQPWLAVDQERPEVIYSVIGYPVHSHRVKNKVYRSTNGGQTWAAIWDLPANVWVTSLAVNPNNREEVVVGYDGGVVVVPAAAEPLPVRQRKSSRNAAAAAADMDVGQIAVLENTGGALSHLFNLNGRTLQFTPSQNGYRGSLISSRFETDLGMRLNLADNDSVEVPLPFSFRFYGVAYTSVFVGSNGNVTFGRRDAIPSPNLFSFAARSPRIAPLWDDFDPSTAPPGGGVFVRSEANRAVITWNNVPEARQTDSNTFQLVLISNQTVLINYGDVYDPVGLIGLSPGQKTPDDVISVVFSQQLPTTFPAAPVAEVFDGMFNTAAIANDFYRSHPDNFEFLVMWGDSVIPDAAGFGAFAYYRPIQNQVQGIGQPTGSFGGGPRAFGSNGRLEGVLDMNALRFYPTDPDRVFFGTNSTMGIFGQEGGHRWGTYVLFRNGNQDSSELLGRDRAHWSFFFDSDASVMEGNDWQDNGNGTFTTDEATDKYSALDQYLMGLRAPSEVASFWFIRNPSQQTSCFNQGPQACPPQLDVTTSGTRVNVSINQIVAAARPRSPAAGAAPTTFHYAFILVVPERHQPTVQDLQKLEAIRQRWESFFAEATGGRGTAIARLKDQAP
jgi:photosystem II stability/assembly factor-like uncharacterized protein